MVAFTDRSPRPARAQTSRCLRTHCCDVHDAAELRRGLLVLRHQVLAVAAPPDATHTARRSSGTRSRNETTAATSLHLSTRRARHQRACRCRGTRDERP
jgi:hypothetical protein